MYQAQSQVYEIICRLNKTMFHLEGGEEEEEEEIKYIARKWFSTLLWLYNSSAVQGIWASYWSS